MSRNFKNALRGLGDTYPSPDPKRRDEFLASLPQQNEERGHALPLLHMRRKPLWYAIPSGIAAAVMLTVGISTYRHHQPHSVPSVPVESTVESVTTTTDLQTASETVQGTTAASESGLFPAQTTAPPVTDPTAVTGDTRSPALTVPFGQSTLPQSVTTAQQGTGATGQNAGTKATDPTEPAAGATTATRPQTTTATTTRQTGATDEAPAPVDTESEGVANGVSTTTAVMTTAIPTYDPTMPATESPTDAPVQPETESPNAEPTGTVDATLPYKTTVTPSVTYEPTGTIYEWQHFYNDAAPTGTAWNWWFPLADNSTEIVRGRITAVWYTQCNGMPYTQIDIQIRQIYRTRRFGDTLSVYVPGGYIPLRTLCETYSWARQRASTMSENWIDQITIHEVASSQKPAEVGDECLFFLRESDISGAPQGAYMLAASENLARLYPVDASMEQFADASGQYIVKAVNLS